MTVTLVYVNVKEKNLQEFLEETRYNHIESVKEPGNLRFDILQDASNPCLFTFYEAYASVDAAAAHKQTPHYNRWRERVEPWMAEPRKGVRYDVVYPETMEKW